MKLRMTLAMLAAAGLLHTAVAAPPAVEEAYEVALDDVTLPANEFGSVILRACEDCDLVTLRVEGTTSYVFAGTQMTLQGFRAAVVNMDGRSRAMATVFYRLDDRRVRRIEVTEAPEDDGPGPF